MPYSDEYYLDDQTTLYNNSLNHSSAYVWLATRAVAGNSFYIRVLGSGGGINQHAVCTVNSSDVITSHSYTNGLRPVITLRGNIKTTGGSGTSGSPYTLGF